MLRHVLPAAALGVAAALLADSLAPASATPSAPPTPPAAKQAVVPAAYGHYQLVSSDGYTDTAGVQSTGIVFCPAGSRVLSGGAIISRTDIDENLNASIPASDGTAWQVWVNNSGTTDGTYTVEAVCATGIGHYAVVQSGAYVDPPGLDESTQPSVDCPRGSTVLGGGGYTTSSSPFAIMAGSVPGTTGRGWYAAYNNRSSATTDDYAFAVCGRKPAHYSVVFGAETTIAPGHQGSSSVRCPDGQTVLGGGGAPGVYWAGRTDLNSTSAVNAMMWTAWENNEYSQNITLRAEAVCATLR